MRCPRCTFPIEPLRTAGVEVDHCPRCAGTFFDPGEAEDVFGPQVAPSLWGGLWAASAAKPSKLRCPRDDERMNVHDVQFGSEHVEVDVCPKCIGMWLDQGEGQVLARVVSAAATEQQKKSSGAESPGAASYFFQLFTGLPIEVWNPVRSRPVLVITTVALLVVAFLLQLGAGPHALAGLMLVPAAVTSGSQPWSLLSYGFLHGGWLHLLGNLYFLYLFGDNIEDTLGRRNFTVLYVAALAGGGLAHLLLYPGSPIPVIGASGAVAGLMGAYLVLFPRVQVWQVFFFFRFRLPVIAYLGFWILLQVLGQLVGMPGVAWMAHIGGFLVGAALAAYYRTRASA